MRRERRRPRNKIIIKMASPDKNLLNQHLENIKKIAKITRSNIKIVPLPTKKIIKSVRKAPNERGTKTFEVWQLRLHKRLIIIETDSNRMFRMLTRLPVNELLQFKMEIR